jgi:RNA polymerase sigma factor (TIGR02999 family)
VSSGAGSAGDPSKDRVTRVLLQSEGREPGSVSLDQLLPLVYEELRDIAARHLRGEHDVRTLSATELVHEAYLRMADVTRVTTRGRAYFFAAAAQAMRQIMVDHARRRRRLKRGGGERAITLAEGVALSDGYDVDLLDLERGLERLTEIAARAARVVECRFFGGLSIEDTALALDLTSRTVNRDWQFARAWLHDYLKTTAQGDHA